MKRLSIILVAMFMVIGLAGFTTANASQPSLEKYRPDKDLALPTVKAGPGRSAVDQISGWYLRVHIPITCQVAGGQITTTPERWRDILPGFYEAYANETNTSYRAILGYCVAMNSIKFYDNELRYAYAENRQLKAVAATAINDYAKTASRKAELAAKAKKLKMKQRQQLRKTKRQLSTVKAERNAYRALYRKVCKQRQAQHLRACGGE